MKTILVTFLAFLTICGYSQSTVSGIVTDQKTGEGIPYVNIGVVGTATGTVTADDGYFVLNLSKDQANIVISSIGYESVELDVNASSEPIEVSLKAASYIIESINIVASKLKGDAKIYGLKNENRGNSIGYGGDYLGAEMASAIKIKEPTYLKTANFVINHARGDSMFFRVKVYDFKDGAVGENLLRENVIIADKQKKGLLTVDISDQELVVNNDVLLSLEWIKGDGDKGNETISFNSKKKGKKRGVYLRNNAITEFEAVKFIKNYKLTFYFTGYPYGEE